MPRVEGETSADRPQRARIPSDPPCEEDRPRARQSRIYDDDRYMNREVSRDTTRRRSQEKYESRYERHRSRSPSDDGTFKRPHQRHPHEHSRRRDADDRRRHRRRSHSPLDPDISSKPHRRRRPQTPPSSSPHSRPEGRHQSAHEEKESKSSTAVAITPATGDVVPEEGGDGPVLEKQQPNFAPTGALAAETNTVAGVVLKYNEPPEARKPPGRDAWRMYVFKGDDLLETVELGGRSCWLVGRERLVVDFPVDHPSCSKQHAVIQFRYVTKTNEFGDKDGRVRPYVIDLESANGTTVNADKIPATRYVELRDKDVIQFGLSTREYVLMLPPQD